MLIYINTYVVSDPRRAARAESKLVKVRARFACLSYFDPLADRKIAVAATAVLIAASPEASSTVEVPLAW